MMRLFFRLFVGSTGVLPAMVSSVGEHYGDIMDCLNHNLRMELYHILGDDSYSAELRSLAVRIHRDSRDLVQQH